MATTNTYLTFNGNCEEAFLHYKSVFGGEFNYLGRFSEMPETENYKVPESDKNKIMHVSLPIGTSILMGCDCGADWVSKFIQGNNFTISITASTREEADRIFNDLAKDGKITMPMNQTFWGDYFGMLTDRFGVNWMMSFNEQQSS